MNDEEPSAEAAQSIAGGSPGWRVFVDTGGTFTDCLALDPSGLAHRIKVLSSSVVRSAVERAAPHGEPGDTFEITPIAGLHAGLLQGWRAATASGRTLGWVRSAVSNGSRWRVQCIEAAHDAAAGDVVDFSTDEEAPALAFRLLSRTPIGTPLPSANMQLATTRGTNALLEGRGARTAFFTTQGFGDLLSIGDQSRPDLFALAIVKPRPLCDVVIEVCERMNAQGEAITPIKLDAARVSAKQAYAQGIRSAAVALLHSVVNPLHERALAEMLREIGFSAVSVSSELSQQIRILPRAQTTCVDASLTPVVRTYVDRVQRSLGGGSLRLMSSAGGMTQAEAFRAKDGLLSGPAGGVIGALASAARSGISKVISFDMGGTSTDVARLDGEPTYRTEHDVAGVKVFSPALAIETVASGGGSVCGFAQDALSVGPESAGANPGPACYGAGGPLTMTDVNLLLGRISHSMFPIPVSIEAAESALQRMREQIAARTGNMPGREALLEAYRSVANQRMAEGIMRVSVRHGYDPSEYALLAFGGAGPQHACAIAELLGMRTIIVPREASLLSALGLAHAAEERMVERRVLEPLETVRPELEAMFRSMEREGSDALLERMPKQQTARSLRIRRFVDLRLAGQDAVITVDGGDSAKISALFDAAYQSMYGHAPGALARQVVSLRVLVCVLASDGDALHASLMKQDSPWQACGERMMRGKAVTSGMQIVGQGTCCVVDEGWEGEIDSAGSIILRRVRAHVNSDEQRRDTSSSAEGLAMETLSANRLASIAEMMGEQLRRTAVSTNVKERLDFSCSITDSSGALVISAPHIPVHLGATGHCVRAIIELWKRRGESFSPGDVVVTNHPGFGGSHLPDVTVVTPVFAGDRLIAFASSRAHHAEIGGARPGSMPASATRLIEEGAVIEPTLVIEAGVERYDRLATLLTGGPFPTRSVQDNMADLRAAVAANHRGVVQLRELAEAIGAGGLVTQMEALMARSARLVRESIRVRWGGVKEHAIVVGAAQDEMDDGSAICVSVMSEGNVLNIDFTGTSATHAGNLNATPGIVHSAVMYVLRLLVNEPVPLNDGLLRAAQIVLPNCMLNPSFAGLPHELPAVVGGNTETSQRVVDVLLKALGLSACAQGTMNNTLFGKETWAYYETVCGGAGAGPGFHGAHAVHTHMTNTRITDPEVLERRHPVRLERFAVRQGSGGDGMWRGGDGVVREIVFLEPMSLSVLTQRRTKQPCGMCGGGNGSMGRQWIVRDGGEVEPLASIADADVSAGDRLVMETPGGGGWGAAACATP